MRIVSWNCADHFNKKAVRLRDLNPSLAIVPEVREKHAYELGDSYTTIWDGKPDNRGLLVAAKKPWRLHTFRRAAQHHMVRAQAACGRVTVTLVGVWSMPGPERYVGAVVSGIEELLDDADPASVIVAGDFNASASFDAQNPARHSFDQIAQRLHHKGLRSVWHSKLGQAFGHESTPTYYHQRKREQPFHIDFMFASNDLMERLTYSSTAGALATATTCLWLQTLN